MIDIVHEAHCEELVLLILNFDIFQVYQLGIKTDLIHICDDIFPIELLFVFFIILVVVLHDTFIN